MSTPKRKIGLYWLRLQDIDDEEILIDPVILVEIVKHASALRDIDRVRKFPENNKAQFFKEFRAWESGTESVSLMTLRFETAKYHHRPPLFDVDTAAERESPKKLTEGEGEKTHIALRADKKEALVMLEERKVGMSFGAFVDYTEFMVRRYYSDNGLKRPFKIISGIVPKADFLEELDKLKRAAIVDVYVDKALLKDDFFRFSGRTEEVRDELQVSVKSKIGKDIKEFGRAMYKRHQKGDVSQLRIIGFTHENNPMMLDTKIIRSIQHFEVQLNELTGEVNSDMLEEKMVEMLDSLGD